ncbi:hypothetical protein L4D08_26355 [Photobacterium chitinilyticum]|uniref:hypothetical protein n=1 Tax=Photobacterium chitinilyticum TaxID=2485123 RepID=UPI003D0FF520
MFSKIWKDPVGSKIIATGILSLIGFGAAYFLDLLPSIRTTYDQVANFILGESAIPNWQVGIMGFCTLLVIFVFCLYLKETFFPVSNGKTWKSYNCDNFFGLEWHWTFGKTGGDIYNLYTCCPNCKYQVFPKNASSYITIDSVVYECDSCGSSYGPFNESHDEIESKVRRFIQQKLRTDKWMSKTEHA